jgi:mRNA interferase MazF
VPATDIDRALVTLIPHTTSVRASQFEAVVRVPFLKEGAFDCQNLVTIPHAKLLRMLGRLSSAQLSEVESAVRTWLGLEKSEV